MTLQEALWQDDDRVSGAVCFRNTRIPVETLFQHLAYSTLEDFRIGFPDVTDEMIKAVLEATPAIIAKEFADRTSAA